MAVYVAGAEKGPSSISIERLDVTRGEKQVALGEHLRGGMHRIAARAAASRLGGKGPFPIVVRSPFIETCAAVSNTISAIEGWLEEPPTFDWRWAIPRMRVRVFEGADMKALAPIAGVSLPTMSRWEHGKQRPGEELARLRAFAKHIGLPWDDALLDPPQAVQEE